MKRDNLVWGIILIVAGGAFLVNQLFPTVFGGFSWPWIMVGLGVIFTLAALIGRVGGLMVPGVILLGLGGIFLYQVRSGDWESWAYIWTLIPAFAGLGMVLGGLLDPEMRPSRPAGLIMIAAGLVGYAVFGGVFGLDPSILRFWPVLLIVFGVWVLIKAMRPAKQ
ncbi:MAG: hypothetical protein KIS95_12600 [Anaerolineae bacterium]|nr:hypothetical protein [Promineifilum sp.]MCW5848066.1 hypothetical protein [Anaerolineae bacterium]